MNKLLGPVLGAVLLGASAPAISAPQPQPAPPAAAPVDPASLALARQILTIGIPPEKRVQMFSSIIDSISDQARKSMEALPFAKDKDFKALMDRSTQRMWGEMKPIMTAALPDIFESMARAYAREFSADDLNAMLAFARTPAGQHFFERSPLILKDPDVQAANQRMSAQMLTKLPEIMRENRQDIEDYVAKHPAQKETEKTPVS
jgi:hypothetical protein